MLVFILFENIRLRCYILRCELSISSTNDHINNKKYRDKSEIDKN